MKLHLPSVLVSLAVVAAAALLTSQSQPATLNPALLRVEYVPHPRDYVQIKGTQVYVVPAGKVLVLTAAGQDVGGGVTQVWIDGQREASTQNDSSGQWSSVIPFPAGLTVQAGSTVELRNSIGQPSADRRGWGYLANQ